MNNLIYSHVVLIKIKFFLTHFSKFFDKKNNTLFKRYKGEHVFSQLNRILIIFFLFCRAVTIHGMSINLSGVN